MGLEEGSFVGRSVGGVVGLVVGKDQGLNVGEGVGSTEGRALGEFVRRTGFNVGLKKKKQENYNVYFFHIREKKSLWSEVFSKAF
jgi:uncharacterized protein YcfJ